jgi:protein-S-isoprenylcysteine O-methyltransferase Ste14
MAHEPESVQFALNRVDRSKSVIFAAIVVLFVFVLFTFGFVLAHARMDDDGRSKMLFMATASEMAFIGACAALVAFHVTRMTKTVLNAIELASKK